MVEWPASTTDTGILIGRAMRGLAAICRADYRYQKAGVMPLALALSPADRRQGRCSIRATARGRGG